MKELSDYTEKSDQELVKLTLENQDFFVYIVNRYEDKLFYYILRLTNLRKEDAHDLLQEIFIKVYHNLNGFNPQLKFSSWVYRIAHNHIISNYRKLKSRPQSIGGEFGEKALEQMASNFNQEKEVDMIILRKNIFKVLNSIGIKYKEVLVLKFLDEKSYEEISDIIRKPIGTVGSLVNRAKKKFLQEFKKQNIKI